MVKRLLKAFGYFLLVVLIWNYISTGVIFAVGFILVFQNFTEISNLINPDIAMDKMGEMTNSLTNNLLESYANSIPLILVLTNVLTLGVILLTFLRRSERFLTYVRFVKVKLINLDIGLVVLLGITMNLLTTSLVGLYLLSFPSKVDMTQTSKLLEPLMGGNIMISILVIVIIAPIFEEIVFRGIILNDFKKAVSVKSAIIIQALLFGVFHMNLLQGVYTFILGIVLGLVYVKYRSIWVPIILHGAFNLTAISIGRLELNTESIVMVSILAVIGIGGSLFASRILKNRYVKENYYDEVENGASEISVSEALLTIEDHIHVPETDANA